MSEATDPADDTPLADAPRRRRSPLIDVAVVALGGYMLYWMFGDVRYFLQGSEPRDLGDAATFVEKGSTEDLDDTFVVLRGTPDVQHAARLRIEPKGGGAGRTIGYLRIIEGGGSLFAAIPRTTEAAPQQFEGVFEGRMRRLSESANFPAIQQHFDGERIVEERDATPQALLDALGKRQGDGLTVVDTAGQSITLGTKASVTLVVEQPDVQVQLGHRSFDSAAAAEAAVAALGFPYHAPSEQSSTRFYTFYVRLPPGERESAQAKLSVVAIIPPDAKPADPSVGAAILPWITSYPVAASDITAENGKFSFVPGDNAKPGFLLQDGKLVPRPLQDGRLVLDPGEVRAVRLDRPVVVDPAGYVIDVGVRPRDRWLEVAMWCLVLLVVGWNITSLVAGWRARRA
ncbi:hypothetical protein [Nannocystis sp. SCPEA4]|uniref:hypothetical protein n=1 Tax=Nannocystis sp. SCPEA4 TaxID=2996787 RepID=UPI00226E096B|nr:hypothetical protein [Nannocystis sp. SCPEA4]MCY1061343.1 hypothetical protein [Nannocystis sp. SCPEA4]